MAKGNDFKKPVNNQEIVINEEDEKNKKLIIIVGLSIVVVLGLIIASVSYFNGKTVEDKEKNNGKKDKPTEIVNPPVVEKPEEKPITNVVADNNYQRPTKPVVVDPTPSVPEEPEEESPIISESNSYSVVMKGNTAIVSGVSRYYVSEDQKEMTPVVRVKVMLNKNYNEEDLENLSVETFTTSGSRVSLKDDILMTDETTGEFYFYWTEPVGSGEPRPVSVNIYYDGTKDGYVETYTLDLTGLSIEELVAEDEAKNLVVVPDMNNDTSDAYGDFGFTYEIVIYEHKTGDDIEWKDDTLLTNDEVESMEVLDENIDSEASTNPDDTADKEAEELAKELAKDVTYTVRFEGEAGYFEDGTFQNLGFDGFNNIIVLKVYSPEGAKDIDPNKVSITGVKPDGTSYTDTNAGVAGFDTTDAGEKRYYIYLFYAADGKIQFENEDGTIKLPSFTIDWDGADSDVIGTRTYEFDLGKLDVLDKDDTGSTPDKDPSNPGTTTDDTQVEEGNTEDTVESGTNGAEVSGEQPSQTSPNTLEPDVQLAMSETNQILEDTIL